MISQLLFIFINSGHNEIRTTKTYIIHGKYDHTTITTDNVQQRLTVNMRCSWHVFITPSRPKRSFPQSQDQKTQPQVNEGRRDISLDIILKPLKINQKSHIVHLYNNTSFWKIWLILLSYQVQLSVYSITVIIIIIYKAGDFIRIWLILDILNISQNCCCCSTALWVDCL